MLFAVFAILLTLMVQAGAIAAFTVDMLVYPLDTIKTRYQGQEFLSPAGKPASGARASLQAFRGLYQGIGSVVLATLPAGESLTLLPCPVKEHSGLTCHTCSGSLLRNIRISQTIVQLCPAHGNTRASHPLDRLGECRDGLMLRAYPRRDDQAKCPGAATDGAFIRPLFLA